MMLTKQKLNKVLRNYRVQVPSELKKELLEQYGNTVITEDGRTIEYFRAGYLRTLAENCAFL